MAQLKIDQRHALLGQDLLGGNGRLLCSGQISRGAPNVLDLFRSNCDYMFDNDIEFS